MVEGKGKTYRSTSSPLSFSMLSEVGRGSLVVFCCNAVDFGRDLVCDLVCGLA